MGLSKAEVHLEDDSGVIALLNTSIEINVMTRKLMENTNLAIGQRAKLELVSYINNCPSFHSLYEDTKIAIGGLKTKHLIFVIKARDHNFVSYQPFLNSVKFSQEYKPDEVFDTIIHLYIYQTAVLQTLAPQDLANQREKHIFPYSLNKFDSKLGVVCFYFFYLISAWYSVFIS